MAATYSGNPKDNPKDALRFAIGDTDVNHAMLQDEELAYLMLEFTGNKLLAEAFECCATYLAARTVKKRLGPQTEDATDRLAYYKERTTFYRTQSQFSVVPPLPEYQSELFFEKGMMTNA